MTELIDTLVTQLEFPANTKALDAADKKLKALEKQSKATAAATNVLADEQANLAQKIQDSTEKEQKLRREQTKLRKEIKATKKPTDDQRKALAKVDNEVDQAKQSTQDYRNELKRLGIQQAKIAKQRRVEQGQLKRISKARRQGAASIKAQEQATRKLARAEASLRASQDRAGASLRASQGSESRKSAQQTANFFKRKQARESKAAAKREAAKGPGGLAGVAAAAAPVGVALAGVATAATVVGTAIATVVETGARMESLRARLKTVEGGVTQATAAFSLLQDLAKSTPFELEDVTNAYVRLKSVGIQPTRESLTAFGNIAAAQGKPIIEFIEAVTDATTGEFERLKEFGIKASSQGEKVAFTMGGITTTVGKNAKEIEGFLKNLGETRFAGAMGDQMNTFNGLVSNLKDTWTSFLDQIAQLGVLDEAKLLLKELSGTIGDDLAPIIADLLIAALRQLRELFVFVRDSGGGFQETLRGLSETIQLVATLLQPFLLLWKGLVAIFGLLVEAGTMLHGMLNGLIDILGQVFDTITGLLSPTKDLSSEWTSLGDAWATAASFGGDLVATVKGVTNALFGQAGSLTSVNNAIKEFQKLTGSDGLKTKTTAELTALRQAGDKSADAELRRRATENEKSEKQSDAAKKKQDTADKKKARASDVAGDFGTLNDRQLASFAADPNVAKKLRDKAEKEQKKRSKKRRTKGAAAGKKLAGATLIADINKQFDKNARELAQAETARKLRSGELGAGDAGEFETKRFKQIRDKQKRQFEDTGKLPAGIAQDVRQIAALPSINNLAGRTQAPVISNTINNFDFHDNDFNAIVEGGTFEGSPVEFAERSAPELRKQTQLLLGEAVPNFRSPELR